MTGAIEAGKAVPIVEQRAVMSYETAEHFYTWLEAHVHESEQHDVEQGIHMLLREYPDLVDTHSWPEMRRMAEARA